MTDNAHEIDFQVGAHDVDADTVGFNEGDDSFIKFDIEAQAVFKRLADDIYETPEAGIREPLTNAITAIYKSVNEGYIEEDRGTVEITLEGDDSSGYTLTIRDNGIGITKTEIEEVVSVIGRSTVRDADELAGQFGMGFLSMYKLAGLNGGFIMHTRSRKNDEQISGLWKSGGFAPKSDGLEFGELDEGEYGTKFVIPLKENIDSKSIRGWVENNSEFARIPVIYREFDADGSEQFNEDYGDTDLEDIVGNSNKSLTVTVENEYFKAVSCSNGRDRETLLLDVPISRKTTKITSAPWSSNVSVRLKTENSVVVNGPNEGLRPVSSGEYNGMSESRQEEYIPENRLTEDDIVLPGPIGTRSTLESSEDFWEYVGEKLSEVYTERAATLLESVNSIDDIPKLSEEAAAFLINGGMLPNTPSSKHDKFQSRVKEEYGVSINRDLARGLNIINRRVNIAPRDGDVSKKSEHQSRPIVQVMTTAKWGEFSSDSTRDGEVYMGVSMNSWKAEAVHLDNEHNVIVCVEDSSWYDIYEQVFGWKKLRSIRKTNFESELDLSDAEVDRVLTVQKSSKNPRVKPTNIEESSVKLHMGDDSRGAKLSKLKESLEEIASGESPSDAWSGYHKTPKCGVIAVPRSAENNLGDVEWANNDQYASVSVNSEQWEYLEGTPGVYHADDFVEELESATIQTSEGIMTVKEAKEMGTLFVHITDQHMRKYYLENAETIAQMLVYEPWRSDRNGFDSDAPSDIVYAVMTETEARPISPALKSCYYTCTGSCHIRLSGTKLRFPNDKALYMLSELSEWWGSKTLDFLEKRLASKRGNSEQEFRRVVEMLKNLQDAGVSPNEVSVDI